MDVATFLPGLVRKESRSLKTSPVAPVGDGALQLTGSIQTGAPYPRPTSPWGFIAFRCSGADGLQEVRSSLGAGVQAVGTLNGISTTPRKAGVSL